VPPEGWREYTNDAIKGAAKAGRKIPLVVKLTSGGKTYIDMCDAQIRDRWLKSTPSWMQSNVLVFMLFPVMALVTFLVDKRFFKSA
jgi:hypothetical protein